MECSDSPNPWLASGLTYICIDSDSPTHNRTERSGRQIDSDFEMSLIFAIRVCAGQLWSVHSHNNKLQQLFWHPEQKREEHQVHNNQLTKNVQLRFMMQ